MQISEYINALPDAYRKGTESNNYKILRLEERLVSDLRMDIEAVEAALDIHNATGATLDLYGEAYSQPRGGMTDEQYRYIILQRVARNMAKGDYNSIVMALAVAFGVPTENVSFAETENPAEVEVRNMPYTVLQSAGITEKQLRGIILAILPAGVSLAPVMLEGTFEFSAYANEYDETAGFGDIEQNVGGYLGLLETNDIDIPT